MHPIQQKLLNLAKTHNVAAFTLRKIGELINEPGSPQKIKHHLDKLIEKGLLLQSGDGQTLKPASGGIDQKTKLASLPIVGAANCGAALEFADQKVEGYLKVSLSILHKHTRGDVQNLFVLKAVGNSMNRANIGGKNIEEGDYIILEKNTTPVNGDYVVSVIDGAANVKRFYRDEKNQHIVLASESSQDFPPMYIAEGDYANYFVCGRVVDVMKKPDEMIFMRDRAAADILKHLGPISKEAYDYYENV